MLQPGCATVMQVLNGRGAVGANDVEAALGRQRPVGVPGAHAPSEGGRVRAAAQPKQTAPRLHAREPAILQPSASSCPAVAKCCCPGSAQIGAKVVRGERLEFPPRDALPGPDTGTFSSLEAYCQLIGDCWAQAAEQRPSMTLVVRRLRSLQAGAEPRPSPAEV